MKFFIFSKLFQSISTINPDILIRVRAVNSLNNFINFSNIFRIHRLSTKEGNTLNPFFIHCFHKLFHGILSKRFAIIKIPSFTIKAIFTIVSTTRYKQTNSYTRSICSIICFNGSIIHIITTF